MHQGFEMLKKVLPQSAIYGQGVDVGPSLFMTDDSTAEGEALQSSWKTSTLLLCTFHFLQRCTWLHDGKHRIQLKYRLSLMKMIKALVYSKSEIELKGLYGKLKSNEIAFGIHIFFVIFSHFGQEDMIGPWVTGMPI